MFSYLLNCPPSGGDFDMTIVTLTSASTVANAQQGQIQVESEGDLEATLNGDSFTTGDTITNSGTVEDRAVELLCEYRCDRS